jgi:hypothetical protein
LAARNRLFRFVCRPPRRFWLTDDRRRWDETKCEIGGGWIRISVIFRPSTALISKNNGAERGRAGGRRPGAECGEAGAKESVDLEANPKLLFSFHTIFLSSTGKAAERTNGDCRTSNLRRGIWDVVLNWNCLRSSDPDAAGSRRPSRQRAPAEAQRTALGDQDSHTIDFIHLQMPQPQRHLELLAPNMRPRLELG